MSHQFQETSCLLCGSNESENVYTTKTHMMKDDGARFHFERCNNCHLVYINPQVSEKELGVYYPNYYLPYRGEKAWGKFANLVKNSQRKTDLKRVKIARKFLSSTKSNILDVGCGNPTFLQQLTKYGYTCTGIDFKSEGWDEQQVENEQMHLIEGDPNDFQFDTSFDLITMWHYLEHDYNPRKTLEHIRNFSHRDTRLVIEVPDYDSISRKFFGANWQGFHAPRHTAIYIPSALKKVLEKSGC